MQMMLTVTLVQLMLFSSCSCLTHGTLVGRGTITYVLYLKRQT